VHAQAFAMVGRDDPAAAILAANRAKAAQAADTTVP
jgi:hypothetical protein